MKKQLFNLILKSGILIQTNYKAQTWSAITTSLNYSNFSFYDSNNGLIHDNSGYRVTSNGGQTWSGILSLNFGEVYHQNALTIVGGTDNGRIYKSIDGGLTFTQKGTPVADVRGIDFFGNFGLIADGNCYSAVTLDGGETWVTINKSVLCNNLSTINDVNVVDATTAYLGGNNGKFFKTTNAGVTWTALTSGGNISNLSFVNANVGFIMFQGGGIAKTTDGGATLNTTITANITSLGGVTASDLRYVLALDANTVFVSGNNKIYKSTDGGATFTSETVSSTCTTCILGKLQQSNNILFVGSTDGKIHQRANAFTPVGINESKNNSSVVNIFPNPSNGLLNIQVANRGENAQVIIYNSMLQKCIECKLTEEPISIEKLNNGIYFIEVKNNNSSSIHKIIKE